jgi:hypothetical protein
MVADGTTAFIQLVYSSMGLSASTQMTSRVFNATKGLDKIKTISSSAASFQASEDRFSCVTDDMTIDFDKASRTYHVKAAYGEEVVFDFNFVLETDGISCQTFFTQGKDSDGYGMSFSIYSLTFKKLVTTWFHDAKRRVPLHWMDKKWMHQDQHFMSMAFNVTRNVFKCGIS